MAKHTLCQAAHQACCAEHKTHTAHAVAKHGRLANILAEVVWCTCTLLLHLLLRLRLGLRMVLLKWGLMLLRLMPHGRVVRLLQVGHCSILGSMCLQQVSTAKSSQPVLVSMSHSGESSLLLPLGRTCRQQRHAGHQAPMVTVPQACMCWYRHGKALIRASQAGPGDASDTEGCLRLLTGCTTVC